MKYLLYVLFLLVPVGNYAQKATLDYFSIKTDSYFKNYVKEGLVDYSAASKDIQSIEELRTHIENVSLEGQKEEQLIAFYINAYNVIVIHEVLKAYPIPSVQEIGGFFDRKKHAVAGEMLTLNDIEKKKLLSNFPDPRYHFVLVCGAMDCPQITNEAIFAAKLSQQLDQKTKAALSNEDFIRKGVNGYGLSQIFKWFPDDFGNSRAKVVEFINRYREEQLDVKNTYYYDYNWTLNDTKFKREVTSERGNNSYRYVTSAAISEGGVEFKVFNNLYSQKDGSRSSYFTSSISFLYGLNNRFNVGLAGRYRRVFNSSEDSSPLEIFNGLSSPSGRQRFSAIGPQIRWAPFEKWEGFSIQSSLTFPLGANLANGADTPFLDWSGPVFIAQFFNDQSIGDKFSLFTEVDFLMEEIGGSGKSNRVSIPVTSILSWYPVKNVTLYGLAGFSPYAVIPFDYFYQYGLGFKYQMTPNFEIELLASDFRSRYLLSVDGSAATYNIGVRYSR